MPVKKEVSNSEILEAVNYIKQNSATKKELTAVTRKEDTKVIALAELLHKKKIISDADLKFIISM